MNKFKPSKLTLAILSSGMIALATPALAYQEAEEEEVKAEEVTQESQEEQVLTITGIRGSLIRSQAVKRNSSSIVEAISAEDIGKLPDSSIAESIARMPGIAAQRLDGRASRVAIRGFGENHSGTTLNGREQVSISDNRGVEFDLYPSEIMSGVTVYKTPNATLDAEGIAGSIDLQTIRPLSAYGKNKFQINGLYEQTSLDKLNPDGDDRGMSGSLFYMDKFANDTLGLAVAYANKNSPNQEKRWATWGYPTFNVDGTDYSVLGGAKPFVRSSMLERESLMAVVEYAPNDDLHLTVDLLNVDFKDEKILRGIEIPFAWGQGSVSGLAVDSATGFVTEALTQGQRVVVRNDYETREADLNSFGVNLEWAASNSLMLEFDASYSKVERDVFSFESYAGTGRGDSNGVADNIGYVFNGGNTGATFSHGLDYSDFNLIQLGGPLTWGWSSALNEQYGLGGTEWENTAQDGFLNAPSIDDELTALKFAATQELNNELFSKVTYGVSYRDREKNKYSRGYYLTLADFSLDNPGTVVVPEQYRLGSANLDFIGMGNMIAYNSLAFLNDGGYNLLDEALTGIQHLTKSYQVAEEVTSAFISAQIDTEVADMMLTGDVGVRYVRTKQTSNGYSGAVVDGIVETVPNSEEHDYTNILPSLNLALHLDERQKVRFGAAKTISRPRMDQMNASVQTTYNNTPDANGNYWSVSGGNTSLEPIEATGFDLTYDNYFTDDSYFSAAYFHKSLDSWIFPGSYAIDMTGVADPATGEVPPSSNSAGTRYGEVNGGDGTLKGLELSLALSLGVIDDSLDGFGILASHTIIDLDMVDQNGNEFMIPGLSEKIQSFTGYYEKNGFSFRASMRKRDDFSGDVYGLGFNTDQVAIVGETIWDAQIGFDFGEAGIRSLDGLSIYLQGLNINDEPFKSLSGDNSLQVRDYQEYGSTYLLGFSYKIQ
ncbi:TonB-dependent receptor [Aliikangiella sp. G2MR2-5]|uniref:TonB-dependent receptor n=1 Tax=Aliikangiella sp. G2MR2-5 TaxID=2788943 RepID=UPI0018AA1035|nr:TonB-dependent receptor [Aliikangiella sp. G2MR2-5]